MPRFSLPAISPYNLHIGSSNSRSSTDALCRQTPKAIESPPTSTQGYPLSRPGSCRDNEPDWRATLRSRVHRERSSMFNLRYSMYQALQRPSYLIQNKSCRCDPLSSKQGAVRSRLLGFLCVSGWLISMIWVVAGCAGMGPNGRPVRFRNRRGLVDCL